MNNADLERIYKINAGACHADGLRGVFNAGYANGAGLVVPAAGDPSQALALSTALTITPIIKTRTRDN
jgi:hypothetical protein